VGDVRVDIVCARAPRPGERLHAEVSVRAGGSAVNAAARAAASGATATVIGRIGNDPAGDLVKASVAAHGVEALLARDDEVATGASVAFGTGQISVVTDRGANARFSHADLPDPLEGDALLVSGFALFQPGSAAAGHAALDRFTGRWTAVDLASPKLAAQVDVERLAREVKIVFATAEEALALTGAKPEEAALQLASSFEVVCVKLGPDGALAAQAQSVERCSMTPVAKQAPFGAGDAFAAEFLVSLAGGDQLTRALSRACEAGAGAATGG
jgi:sugar/nucleoside kinase (ribokinase family)